MKTFFKTKNERRGKTSRRFAALFAASAAIIGGSFADPVDFTAPSGAAIARSSEPADVSATSDDLSVLPNGGDKKAEPTPHFPNRTAAFVWRNWNLAPIDKMAETLETSPEKIAQIADLLGLPPYVEPAWDGDRIYITLTRRNWHLLPYSQLLTLLDLDAKSLAEKLREDDFLYIKLGGLKPVCEPLTFEEPTDADVAAMKRIAAEVRDVFGDELNAPETPRFAFLDEFAEPTDVVQIDKNVKSVETSADVAKRRFSLCYLHSYFAVFGDPLLQDSAKLFPDALFQKLSERGINGVWLHALLRDLTPPTEDFPEFGDKSDVRRENLRNLVNRGKKYGIDVYLYMNEPRAMPASFFESRSDCRGVAEGDYCAMCASSPKVKRWLTDSLAYLFADVPGLGGIFTITGSENLTSCVSHGGQAKCPRCSQKSDVDLIVELNEAMAEGVRRSAPNAKTIVWDWGWRGHAIATDIIERLPKDVWLQSVSEWALPLNRGGVETTVGEYSISAVGPGPRATAHWAAAKKAGLKTIAKCQFNATWEIASIPAIPALDLVVRHAANLARADVDGVMAGWSLGGFPSVNLEALRAFDGETIPTEEAVLDDLANRLFGEKGAALGRDGWTKVSRAFEEFPYGGSVMYCAPTQIGPANLLRLEPTGFAATMVGIPYDDLNAWRGPYPPEVFASQMDKCGDGFRDGAESLKRAAEFAPEERRIEAERQGRYAEAAGVVFKSVANQTRFVALRDERISLLNAENLGAAGAERLTEVERRMVAIARDEIELAKALRRIAAEDSCVGFESTNQYWFVPRDLVEKVVSCLNIIDELEKK